MKKTFFIIVALSLTNLGLAQWTPVNNGLPATTARGVGVVSDTLFTAIDGHGVYYSINNGDNWEAWKYNAKLPNKNISKMFRFSTSPQPGSNTDFGQILIGGKGMLTRYVYQLGNSVVVNYSVPEDVTVTAWLEDGNSGEFYIGTTDGVYYYHRLEKSLHPSSLTFTKASGISGIVNHLRLEVHDDDTETLIASTNNGLYKSTDLGKSFTPFTGILVTSEMRAYENYLFLATSNGIFGHKEKDGEITYTPFNESGDYRTIFVNYTSSGMDVYAVGNNIVTKLNQAGFEELTTNGVTGGAMTSSTVNNGYLFVSTDEGGVFRLPIDEDLGIADFRKAPEAQFNVSPNPSNGTFTIYSDQQSEIQLIDMTGKLIRSFFVNESLLINEKLSPGIYLLKDKTNGGAKKIIIK
jgi:hypothetical protein